MKTKIIFAAAALFIVVQFTEAQTSKPKLPPAPPPPAPIKTPPPPVKATPPPETLSGTIPTNLPQQTEVSRERREQAYAKLLEGQRYIWSLRTARTQDTMVSQARLAKQALQKAVELDPNLAEAYTALAEVAKNTPPYNINDSLMLANLAVKVDPDNFGGHYILAQIYTFNSQINRGVIDETLAAKAVAEWQEIIRLDPRNAEAYAFLSEFYARMKKPQEQINALRNWLSAAAPINNGIYGRIFRSETLSSENASLKLATVLAATGKTRESIEILSILIADNPDNEAAIDLLQKSIETADADTSKIAVQALQQAAYANPANASLSVLTAQVQARTGNLDGAAKTLREASARRTGANEIEAGALLIVLGDLFAEKERYDDAAKSYQDALTARGVGVAALDDERDFAIRVFDRLIDVYQRANRPNEVQGVIENARRTLGANSTFADTRLIGFYRETGKRQEALQAVRALRAKNSSDRQLLQLEATLLTELGKVDEAVALVKTSMKQGGGSGSGSGSGNGIGSGSGNGSGNGNGIGSGNGSGNASGSGVILDAPISAISQDVLDYLFISELYTQANRGKDAVQAVNQALTAAKSRYEMEVVKLTLATAQQNAGDFKAAETTLRDILAQSPTNATALNNLGYFLAERGEKLDEAVKLVQQALQLDPDNASFLDSLGWAYFKLGKLDDAEKYIKDALRVDDSEFTLHEHLGDIYQKQGKADAAKAAWQKALTLASNKADVDRLKGKLNVKITK